MSISNRPENSGATPKLPNRASLLSLRRPISYSSEISLVLLYPSSSSASESLSVHTCTPQIVRSGGVIRSSWIMILIVAGSSSRCWATSLGVRVRARALMGLVTGCPVLWIVARPLWYRISISNSCRVGMGGCC